jgi:hypothetical protein
MSATKFIVITGVSRGCGRALAKRLIERGHTVAGCARSESKVPGHPHQKPDFEDFWRSEGGVSALVSGIAERHSEPRHLSPRLSRCSEALSGRSERPRLSGLPDGERKARGNWGRQRQGAEMPAYAKFRRKGLCPRILSRKPRLFSLPANP